MSTPTPTSIAAAVHQEMFDSVMAHDFDRLRELFHQDYTYTGPDGEERGVEAAMAVAETYTRAFPDLELQVRHRWTPADNVSIMEVTFRGTHQAELEGVMATGRRIESVLCNVVEVLDGRLYREREYFDELSLMRQLGVAP